jgi:hypothetical protein
MHNRKIVDLTGRKMRSFWKIEMNELESNAVEEYQSII